MYLGLAQARPKMLAEPAVPEIMLAYLAQFGSGLCVCGGRGVCSCVGGAGDSYSYLFHVELMSIEVELIFILYLL